jgi:hypothetical protein
MFDKLIQDYHIISIFNILMTILVILICFSLTKLFNKSSYNNKKGNKKVLIKTSFLNNVENMSHKAKNIAIKYDLISSSAITIEASMVRNFSSKFYCFK